MIVTFASPNAALSSRRSTSHARTKHCRPPRAAMDTLDLCGYTVVLGTASKWRRELFARHFASVPFTFAAADIDERAAGGARAGADARALTRAIAHAKADAQLPALRGQRVLLLTSDQVVQVAGEIREKPRDKDECRRYLQSYAQGEAVATVTAVVVTDCTDGERVEGVDEARQFFTEIPDAVIEELIARGECMTSAGGVLVEDQLLAPFLARREGELESILGLPVTCVRRLLAEAARRGGAVREKDGGHEGS